MGFAESDQCSLTYFHIFGIRHWTLGGKSDTAISELQCLLLACSQTIEQILNLKISSKKVIDEDL